MVPLFVLYRDLLARNDNWNNRGVITNFPAIHCTGELSIVFQNIQACTRDHKPRLFHVHPLRPFCSIPALYALEQAIHSFRESAMMTKSSA